MLKATAKIFLTILMIAFVVTVCYYGYSFTNRNHTLLMANKEIVNTEIKKLQNIAKQAKIYTKKKGYNTETCFLLDMSLPSGKNRFFEYDLVHDSIITAGLVAHGSCNQNFLPDPKFSNQPGCGCTASGKYKVGNKYKGRVW